MQAILLSAFTLGLVALLRRPERRAGMALVGILACGVIPFVSAFAPVNESVSSGRVIRLDPMLPVAPPLPVEPMVPTVFSEPVAASGGRPESAVPPPAKIDPSLWILRVWMVGILAAAFLMIGELLRTRCWLRTLVAPDEREWDLIRDVAPEGFSRDQIRISAAAAGPCVVGFWKPRIVVPGWLLQTRHHRELDWTLRHELEHLRSHDSRWIHVVRAIRIVQWWNALLHRLIAVWSQAREQACDLHAIRHADEGPDYGHFLLKVAGGKPSRFAAAMAVRGETKRLRRRITGLLKSPVSKPAPVSAGWQLAMGGLMVGVAFFTSTFDLARAPEADGAAAEDDMSWLEPKPIVYLDAVVIVSPEPFAKQGEVLTNDEFRKRLEAFGGRKGFDARNIRWHSLMDPDDARCLQLAAYQDNSKKRPPWDGSKTVDPFVGWVIHYQPEVSGATVTLDVNAAYAFSAGEHSAPMLCMKVRSLRDYGVFFTRRGTAFAVPVGNKWSGVKMATVHEKGFLHSGEILSICLGEVEKGVFATCLTGVSTRMPWDYSSTLEIPALASLATERKIDVKVVTTKQSIELTAEEKALSKRIGELRRELSKSVGSNPVNEPLLKLRTESEAELAGEDPAKDKEKAAYLQWRIRRITERMLENCSADFEVDRLQIEHLANDLHSSIFKRSMENPKPDPKLNPTRFNYQEQ